MQSVRYSYVAYEGPNEQGKLVRTLEGKINGLESIVPRGIVKTCTGFGSWATKPCTNLRCPQRRIWSSR